MTRTSPTSRAWWWAWPRCTSRAPRSAPTGIRALASVAARGHPAGYLAADRAYSSAATKDFQLPAASLGYKPVYDYRSDQLGVKGNFQAFLLIEGAWYCPSIPRP